jgi:hypothetical protein
MKISLVVVGLLALVVCAAAVPLQTSTSANPVIGTWKQNMEKSTYSPGPAPPKGSTSFRQYAAGEDGSIVAITMNISQGGLPSLGAISAANYDGREYAQHTLATLATSLRAHVGPQITRTIAYTPIDRNTVEIIQRQDGMVVAKSKRTISQDGKTMTDSSDYLNPQGDRVTNVLVFEKQ